MRLKLAVFLLVAVTVFSVSTFTTLLPVANAQVGTQADGASRLAYPETKRSDVVDYYFGTKVADPYRWLENNDSVEVASWVDEGLYVTAHKDF
jgi:prolyl oligopeptidase